MTTNDVPWVRVIDGHTGEVLGKLPAQLGMRVDGHAIDRITPRGYWAGNYLYRLDRRPGAITSTEARRHGWKPA